MKTNEHEISSVYKLAEKIGVDILTLKTFNIGKNNPRYNDFIPQNIKYRRKKIRHSKLQCPFINPNMPVMLWNGDIVPCCFAILSHIKGSKEYLMGNAFEDNLLDIWDSIRYKKFRTDYEDGKNKFCNEKCGLGENRSYIKRFNFNKK